MFPIQISKWNGKWAEESEAKSIEFLLQNYMWKLKMKKMKKVGHISVLNLMKRSEKADEKRFLFDVFIFY